MHTAFFTPYILQFKNPVLTSRGAMNEKHGFFIRISDGKNTGVGECSFIEGLSRDDLPQMGEKIEQVCANISDWESEKELLYEKFPSLLFA